MSATSDIDTDCPFNKKRSCFDVLAGWIMDKITRFRTISQNRHIRGCSNCLYVGAYRRRSYDRFVEDDSITSSDRNSSPDQEDSIILAEFLFHANIDNNTAISKEASDCEDTESYLTLSPLTSDAPYELNVANLPDTVKFRKDSNVFTDSSSLSSSLTEVTSVSSCLSDDFDSWCLAARRSIPHNHHRWFDKFETSCLIDKSTKDGDKRCLFGVHNENQRNDEVWKDKGGLGESTKTRGYMD